MDDLNKYNPKGSNLRKAQLKMIYILDTVANLLDKNNIPYWLDGGTALGAVRHGGFIPWDDDLDIDIKDEDYSKVIKILTESLPSDLIVQCRENTVGYSHKHIKVRDKKSIFVEKGSEHLKERGIFIDIFPANKTNYKFQNKINSLKKNQHKYKSRSKLSYLPYFIIFRTQILVLKLISIFLKKDAFVTPGFEKYCYPLRLTSTLKKIEFEGSYYSAVNDLDEYLRIHYGDYMTIPKEENRIVHTSEIIFIN